MTRSEPSTQSRKATAVFQHSAVLGSLCWYILQIDTHTHTHEPTSQTQRKYEPSSAKRERTESECRQCRGGSNQQLATSNQQWRQWRPVCELAHTHMHRHSRPQLRLFSAEDRSLCARMGAHQAHRLRIRSERMKLCKRRPVCVCVCVCNGRCHVSITTDEVAAAAAAVDGCRWAI